MWLSMMKTLPLASQEASGAIEAYHVKLKMKLFDDSHLGAFQRVDWLVHKLTTELHSGYWLDRFADESDSFQNIKDDYVASTSWHRALQIPDSGVTLDDKECLFAKVLSQKDASVTRLVWNPGSEFAFCDCAWSLQGNLCKHIIKVNMICGAKQEFQAPMSSQSFEEILMTLRNKPMDDSIEMDQAMAWTLMIHDQIKKLVELNGSKDIGTIVKDQPLSWVSKKSRTQIVRPSTLPALPSSSNGTPRDIVSRKKNRKRRRLSRLV